MSSSAPTIDPTIKGMLLVGESVDDLIIAVGFIVSDDVIEILILGGSLVVVVVVVAAWVVAAWVVAAWVVVAWVLEVSVVSVVSVIGLKVCVDVVDETSCVDEVVCEETCNVVLVVVSPVVEKVVEVKSLGLEFVVF